MWYETKITKLLGIQYPILQGPMGGGFSTPDLLAEVSNAGGLGSYGAYTLTPAQILEADKEIRARTNKPYNINLWVSDVDEGLKDLSADQIQKVRTLFKPYFDELGIPLPDLSPQISSQFEKQVEVIFKIRPAVFSFIFGIPSKEVLAECRRLGIKTIGGATTLDEALALEEAGVDAVSAVGVEAGGHRPAFLQPATDASSGTFALVVLLAGRIKIPIIAAGGITDGRGAAAAFTLGADAVQLGTAFLACHESNATHAHRSLLFSKAPRQTVLSKSMTGRLGRMLRNRITEQITPETAVLPFPLQTRLLAPLKAAALKQGRTDLVNFWAGQSTAILKHTKAAGLMQSLIGETGELLAK